jgi:hypothetical protein
VKPTPVREIPQTDPKELAAIEAAVRAGKPLYFIQSGGSCLDVALDGVSASKIWASIADRSGLGYRGVQCFKRVGTYMFPLTPPRQVAA